MNPRDIPPEAFHASGAEVQAIDFGYVRSPDQDSAAPAQHPVVIVGAGPVGLSLAIDLAQRGQRVVVLDNDHKLSIGSRAICFSKRTLEIWDRLGVGQRMVDKGVSWNLGKVFLKDEQLYEFCCPKKATSAPPSSTFSSTTPRPTWWSAPCSCRASTSAGTTR